MDRRTTLVALASSVAATLATLPAAAQGQPFALRLVRRAGFQELMGKNKCEIGDLYVSTAAFMVSDVGTKLANALELAIRDDALA